MAYAILWQEPVVPASLPCALMHILHPSYNTGKGDTQVRRLSTVPYTAPYHRQI